MKIYVFVLGILFSLPSVAQNIENKPNVVIIFADDMGYGDISALNPESKIQTKNIDYLIKNGFAFTDAHASASVCTPSRYGLLTGRYAFRGRARTGINGFGTSVIEKDRKTLAHMFKASGYHTACIGKWHLGVDWQTKDNNPVSFSNQTGQTNVDYSKPITNGPNDHGFDYSFIHTASLDMPPYLFIEDHEVVDQDIVLTSDLYKSKLEDTEYAWDRKHTKEGDVYWRKMVWWRKGEISNSFRIEDCLSDIMDKSKEYILAENRGKPSNIRDDNQPFFLYIPLTGPHTPWVPEDQFKGQSEIGEYGDFVLNIDDVVGRIIDYLKSIGEFENTMIIFSSDNGAYWPESEIEITHHDSNFGSRGQKGDVWDGGHHIPLVFHWPAGIEKNQQYHSLTSLTDIYATLAEFLGYSLDRSEGEDSFSFKPVLFSESTKSHRSSMVHQGSNGMFAIRYGKWKYIDGLGSGGFTYPSRAEPSQNGAKGQLYKIFKDPLESNNLYLSKIKTVNRLKSQLELHVESNSTKEL